MKQDTLEGKAKTKNGIKRLCFSIICILLEVIFIITIVTRLNEYAEIINLFTRILSGILVLGLYASNKTSSMKMPWIILILIFPIMGVGLYLLIGLNGGTHKMRERYAEIDSKLLPMLPDSQECLSRIKETIPKAGNIASYIQRNSQYPIYQNTDIVYFDEAVKGLEAQLKDLEKAQKFIFMEYHAIEESSAFLELKEILVQKAKETGLAIDATQGRRTKSVLVMENSQIVLSALLPETIAGRAQALWPEDEKEDSEEDAE